MENLASASDELKLSTAELHRRLDHSPLSAAMVSGQRGWLSYAQYLWVFYGIYDKLRNPFEVFWERAIPTVPFMDRTNLLARDLTALGKIQEFRWDTLRAIAELNPPKNNSEMWGMAYVLEGSQLGALFLKRGLEKRLHPKRDIFCFLTGAGERTAARWTDFKRALDDYGAEFPDSVGEMKNYANHLFGVFIDGFSEVEKFSFSEIPVLRKGEILS